MVKMKGRARRKREGEIGVGERKGGTKTQRFAGVTHSLSII